MLNQLTERNLELWKEFQQNLVGGVGRPAASKPKDPGKRVPAEPRARIPESCAPSQNRRRIGVDARRQPPYSHLMLQCTMRCRPTANGISP